ncbi:MAG: bifunctional folylpolyglutamate synthase/dihydrofolate synthase, partial [Erythrobacter sp.]
DWDFASDGAQLAYHDGTGALQLPLPALPGAHQAANAALAIAMLRHQNRLTISEAALGAGLGAVRWPARLQRLGEGPLSALVSQAVWLDGGHNPSAGIAIAAHFQEPLHLIIGMIAGKNPRAIIDPLGDRVRTLTVVPVPGHEWHPVSAFGPSAQAAATIADALLGVPSDGFPILITGSLYLAGEVLRLNREPPA